MQKHLKNFMRLKMTDSFCVLPWIHLATHPHGGASLCCVADFKQGNCMSRDGDRYYNLNRDTIADTMNSEKFRQTRLEMLDGKKPSPCMRCYQEERRGIKSKRLTENEKYSNFTYDLAKQQTQTDGRIDSQLEFVELRLGNICNAKCATCNPASSSKWIMDYRKLSNKLDFITNYDNLDDFSWPEREEFWDDLYKHTKNVKTFYINGGEPTLVKAHWEFIKRLIAEGRTDITLWYNTNMISIPDFAFDLWKNFKHVQISCSIDDLGERNQYIRFPTKWADVESNLDKLTNYPWLDVSVNQTVSVYNYYYLPDFWNYMKDRGMFVHHNFVHDPVFLSPAALPEDFRKKCHDRFKECGWENWRTDNLVNSYSGSDNKTMNEKARQYINALDKIRNTNFNQVFPEMQL